MYLIEIYSKVRIGKQLSDTFPIQNGLQQGDALVSLLFNFALQYIIWKMDSPAYGSENDVMCSTRWNYYEMGSAGRYFCRAILACYCGFLLLMWYKYSMKVQKKSE
jgi:hypothetical protein